MAGVGGEVWGQGGARGHGRDPTLRRQHQGGKIAPQAGLEQGHWGPGHTGTPHLRAPGKQWSRPLTSWS